MSLDVDALVDRRRLRRKLSFWRVVAIVAVVVTIGWALAVSESNTYFGTGSPHVARVTIGGLIRTDRKRQEMLEKIAKSGAQAVILSINSPGGTVAGAEQLYDGLRRLAEKKPVVAVVEGLAASGAYIAAMGSDRIFAPRTAIVGSIGVIFQYPNFYELLKHVGVSVEEIKSTPLKAAPSGYSPTSPEAVAAIQNVVLDTYGWFRGLVRERRRLDDAQLALAADGRIFTAFQAQPLKLVDEIGDEQAARAWLKANKGVADDLPVRDWKSSGLTSEFRWLDALAGVAQWLGLAPLASLLGGDALTIAAARTQLDGLLAIWQPPLAD
jgi:protease-4